MHLWPCLTWQLPEKHFSHVYDNIFFCSYKKNITYKKVSNYDHSTYIIFQKEKHYNKQRYACAIIVGIMFFYRGS